jgi:hypothetical protein
MEKTMQYSTILTVLSFFVLQPLTASDTALPPGDYQQSCSKCTFKNNVLSCDCKTKSGKSHHSTVKIEPQQDPWVTANMDGHLRYLPNGPYLSSCSPCTIKTKADSGKSESSLLTCACQTGDATDDPSGDIVNSTLKLDPTPQHGIYNCFGHLQYGNCSW